MMKAQGSDGGALATLWQKVRFKDVAP